MMTVIEPKSKKRRGAENESRKRELSGRIQAGMPRLYVANPGEDDIATPAGMYQRQPSPRISTAPFGMGADLRISLQVLSAHQGAVGGFTRRMSGRDIAKNELKVYIDETIKAIEDQGAMGEAMETYMAALEAKRSGDPKKMLALCELRKEAINNFVRARSHFLELFFEEQTLGQNDSAYIINETMYPQAVYYMGQDGKLQLQRAIAARSNFLIPLYYVASEKYGYQIEDLQRGNITAPALATVDIAWDIAQQLDLYARQALTGMLPRASTNGGVNGVFGNFVTSLNTPTWPTGPNVGKPYPQQLWTYNAHPAVQVALLPTTNVLTPYNDPIPAGLSQGRLAGMLVNASNQPVIGFNSVHSVLQYSDQWGGVFMDGPLRPTGLLIVPAIDAASILGQITVTGAKPTTLAEGLLSNYTRFDYGGVTWTMMPDATIPRGTIYGVLNKPVGRNFTKPSFDREFVNTDFENNWEDRWYRKTQGLYIPVQWAPRAVAVTYM
jgi:hypothetical protein